MAAASIVSQFADLSRRLADAPVELVLDDVLDLVLSRVDGASWAGVLEIPRPGVSGLRVVSAPIFNRVTGVQIATHEGPCLQAATHGEVVTSSDFTRESRWPAFVRETLATTPVRSVLSMPVHAVPTTVLSVFSDRPGAMASPLAVASARLLAELTSMLLLHARAEARAASLVDALDGRRQLGVAQGVLMGRYGLDEQAAHDLLLGVAAASGLSVADVVTFVVLTRSLPGVSDADASGSPEASSA